MIPIVTIMTISGLIGAVLCVTAYILLAMGRITADRALYFILNGIGGFLILISIAYDYDGGDSGGLFVEVCWVIISIIGLLKIARKGKEIKDAKTTEA